MGAVRLSASEPKKLEPLSHKLCVVGVNTDRDIRNLLSSVYYLSLAHPEQVERSEKKGVILTLGCLSSSSYRHRMKRTPHLQAIQALDPIRDHVKICQISVGYEFPWEMSRAMEIALLRTFCVPQIAQQLQSTGKFIHHAQQRYDDTGLIVADILKWGYDSPQGAAAIARMNRIHSHYSIAQDDYLYVLSTLIYEPIHWNQRFGWRPFCDREKQAFYQFWKVVGTRMGIQAIPDSYEAFEQFKQAFEQQYFKYDPANQAVGNAVIALVQTWLPWAPISLVHQVICTMLDDLTLQALGWSRPIPIVQALITQTLKLRQVALTFSRSRHRPQFFSDQPSRSYPQGYTHNDLDTYALAGSPPTVGTKVTAPGTRCPFARLARTLKS